MSITEKVATAARWLYRSAISGRFVTKEEAQRKPKTTVRERRK